MHSPKSCHYANQVFDMATEHQSMKNIGCSLELAAEESNIKHTNGHCRQLMQSSRPRLVVQLKEL